MIDSLRHYWRVHLAVGGAVAVLTAVLVGALLVGDSMRGSLRALTLDRLGRIDHVVTGQGTFFRARLAEDLSEVDGFVGRFEEAVGALLLQGSIDHPDSGRRAAQVNIQGVDDDFVGLFPGFEDSIPLDRADGQPFPSAVVNRALADELGASVGDQLIVALARPSDVPRESLMGSTDPADVVQTVRVQVRSILENEGPGRFGLFPHQTLPANVFLPLRTLQRALDQRRRVNAVLVAGAPQETAALQQLLEDVVTLEDYGLDAEVLPSPGGQGELVHVTSREVVLRPAVENYLARWAEREEIAAQPISTYLANRTAVVTTEGGASDRLLPYSTIAALDVPISESFGALNLVGGDPAPTLADDEILVNEWALEDLGAQIGDRLRVEYWEVGDREELRSCTQEFRLSGVVAMTGLGVDDRLTPDFPGVADADNMADWDPTFPVDLGLITDRDEEYWDLYRGTPKLFVNQVVGRQLWGNRFGELSALRFSRAGSAAEELAEQLAEDLPRELAPEAAGVAVLGIKFRGLQASRGATDFSGLFVGFSFFLIISAVLLVSLFYRLGVEQRAPEIGLRLATGWSLQSVRRGLLGEGLVVAAVGVLVGLAAALGYAALMMWGLGTVWVGAVGSRFLTLHVQPVSLIGGGIGSLLLIALVIRRSVASLASQSAVSLLRGDVSLREAVVEKRGRWSRRIFIASLAMAALLLAASFAVPTTLAAPVFMGLGAMLLAAGLAAVALRLGAPSGTLVVSSSLAGRLRLAANNASLVPSRSLLSVALVASATFVIVAVGSYGHRFDDEAEHRESGTGGFDLRATADVPIYQDLASAEGRFEIGFSDEDSELLASSEIYSFGVVPGDDVSCLNLYQPTSPRLLGVSAELRDRGGFAFQQLAEERERPWELLEGRLEDGAIPVFGDFNSVMWILKSGLGKDVVVLNDQGAELRLRIVGLLRRSIFQSELLMSQENLQAEFPARGGAAEFLVDAPSGAADDMATLLERRLGRFGFDTRGTEQVLASYQAVENTYLGTFQVLGGLGLLLGTLGLAVVILRGVLERGSELATLRAVGFPRRALGTLVLAENTVLLVLGVGLGTVSALLAVSPHLRGGQALVPWGSLALTLVAICVCGSTACAFAVRYVVGRPLVGSLRGD